MAMEEQIQILNPWSEEERITTEGLEENQPLPRLDTSFPEEQRQDDYSQHPEDELMPSPPRVLDPGTEATTPMSQISNCSTSTVVQGVISKRLPASRKSTPRITTPSCSDDLPVLTPIYHPTPRKGIAGTTPMGSHPSVATRETPQEQKQQQNRQMSLARESPSITAREQLAQRQQTPHSTSRSEGALTALSSRFFAASPTRSTTHQQQANHSDYWMSTSTPASAAPPTTTSRQLVVKDAEDLGALDSELDDFDNTYRSRREILQQRVKEHDTEFMSKSQVFQGKLTSILEKTRQANDEQLAKMEIAWNEKLLQYQEIQNKAFDKERLERAQFVSRLEDKLERRQLEVDELKNQVKGQQLSLKEAHQGRESLQKEIKNILVTLHFQFEHLTNQAANHEVYVKEIEEKTVVASRGAEQNIDEVTSYVDSIQYEVSQIQLETKALWRQCEDEHKAALEEVEGKLNKSIGDNHEELQDELSDQKGKVKVVAEALRAKTSNIEDLINNLQSETEARLEKMEENLQQVKSQVSSESSRRIQDVEDNILQTMVSHMQNIDSQHENFDQKARSQVESTNSLMETIQSVSTKYEDLLKINAQSKSEWETKFDSVRSQLQQHSTASVTMKDKLASLRKKLTDSQESWQEKFAKLSAEHMYQRSAQTELETRHVEQNQNTTELRSNLRTALEHVNVLTSRLGDLHNNHESTSRSIDETRQSQYSLVQEAERKIVALEESFNSFSKEVSQEKQNHEIVANELDSKQSLLESKLASVEQQQEATMMRIRGYESTLANLDTSASVEARMEPFVAKQASLDSKLETCGSLVRSLKDEIQANCVNRRQLQESIDAVRQDSEATFTRISARSQRDIETKESAESAISTLRSQMEQWRTKVDDVAVQQESVKQHFETVLIDQKDGLEQVNMKLQAHDAQLKEHDDQLKELVVGIKDKEDSQHDHVRGLIQEKEETQNVQMNELLAENDRLKDLFAEIKDKGQSQNEQMKELLEALKGQEEAQNAIKLDLVANKESVERRLTDHLGLLTDWKDRIEDSLDKREQKVSKQLKSQQHAADKQAARIVLKAAKTERESCQRELEAKIDLWNERFESYVDQAHNEFAILNENIREVQINTQGVLSIADVEQKMVEWSDNDGNPIRQTKEDILELQKTVANIKCISNDKEKVLVDLERRMETWNKQFNEVVKEIQHGIAQQVQNQTSRELNGDVSQSDLVKNMKELAEMEAKLKMTTQQLSDTRYECRGLRRQLSTTKGKQRSYSSGSGSLPKFS